LLAVSAVIAVGLVAGILPRLRAQTKLAATAQEPLKQIVNVTNVNRLPSVAQLSLPGDVRAFEETRIYARADGYLLKWNTGYRN
jgi:hypothetical protein